MEEDPYICVGICMSDPDSGYCLGCGRPPLAVPEVVAAEEPRHQAEEPPFAADPDTPA
ncbi:MAG: hypothetical protein H6R10_1732 [Rhodocyclaceae bacterium]|nr:hypothetical protein [Rhodocyclaceae bacterium]